MTDDKQHLDIDLEFLDKNSSKKEETAHYEARKKDHASKLKLSKPLIKKILIIGGIVIFFGWIIFSGDNSSTNTPPPPPPPPPPITCNQGTVRSSKSNSCISYTASCAETFPNSEWNKKFDEKGDFICDCRNGFMWNQDQTKCIVSGCSSSECLFNGKCFVKPPHSHCLLNDLNNAWACDEKYKEVGNECICISGEFMCNSFICGIEPIKPYIPSVCYSQESCDRADVQVAKYNKAVSEYNKCLNQKCTCD